MLNVALMRAGLSQRLRHPVALAILGAYMAVTFLGAILPGDSSAQELEIALVAVLVLGAGMIGMDVRGGVLQLVLARPVTRSEYVFSRWFATGTCAAVLSLAFLAAGVSVMALKGQALEARGVLAVACRDVTASYGVASVLALFSTLAPGFADLGLLLVGLLGAAVCDGIGEFGSLPWMTRTATEIRRVLYPVLDPFDAFSSTPISWYAIVSYFSTVTLCLALAVVVFNKKEISYAAS